MVKSICLTIVKGSRNPDYKGVRGLAPLLTSVLLYVGRGITKDMSPELFKGQSICRVQYRAMLHAHTLLSKGFKGSQSVSTIQRCEW